MEKQKRLVDVVFSKRLFAIYLATYFVPICTSWVSFVYLKVIQFSDTIRGFKSPVGIIGVIGIITFVLIWWSTQKKKFEKFMNSGHVLRNEKCR